MKTKARKITSLLFALTMVLGLYVGMPLEARADGTTYPIADSGNYGMTESHVALSDGGRSGTSTPIDAIDINGKKIDPSKIDASKPGYALDIKTADIKDDTAYVTIPAGLLTNWQDKNEAFFIEIRTPYSIYKIPANLASIIPDLNALMTQNNLRIGDVGFKITISDKSGDVAIMNTLKNGRPKAEVLSAMVDYKVEIWNNKTNKAITAVDSFTKAITRLIPVQEDVKTMPKYFGAFRYNENSETFVFVPHTTVVIDGVTYIAISSESNSVYMVAENNVIFGDVPGGAWYAEYVLKAAAKGLVRSAGLDFYQPNREITRAEFVQITVNVMQPAAVSSDLKAYADVAKGAWYYDAITRAKVSGWLDKFPGNKFNPNQLITREEMASILAAVLRQENSVIVTSAVHLEETYTDATLIGDAYIEDVKVMTALNLMVGAPGGKFNSEGVTTRAQAATVQIRLLEILGMIDK